MECSITILFVLLWIFFKNTDKHANSKNTKQSENVSYINLIIYLNQSILTIEIIIHCIVINIIYIILLLQFFFSKKNTNLEEKIKSWTPEPMVSKSSNELPMENYVIESKVCSHFMILILFYLF